MDEGKLVYVLPVHKRPEQTKLYGQIGIRTGSVCRIEPTGEVYLYDTATIGDVQLVLTIGPYNLEFEELEKVRVRETFE